MRLIWPTLRRNPARYAALILQFAFACTAAVMALSVLLQEHAMLARFPAPWKQEGVFVLAAGPDLEPPPGVASVQLLLGAWHNLLATGTDYEEPREPILPRVALANGEYVQRVAPRLSAGRWLSPADWTQERPVPVVLNAAAAKRLGNGKDLLGKTLGPNGALRVIGILADGEPLPLRPEMRLQELMVAADPVVVLPANRREVLFPTGRPLEYDRDRAVMWIGAIPEATLNQVSQDFQRPRSVSEILQQTHTDYQSMWRVLEVVAGLILGLAVIGFTGVVLSMLEQRWREYAVRIALGATPRLLTAQLLAETLVTTLSGGILGALAAIFLAPLIGGGLPAVQPLALAAVVIVSVLLSGLLSLAPLRTLLRLKPDEAMRTY